MYLVVIAWLYVTLMMAVAEATNTTGTVLGAIVTFGLYGLLPMGIVVYLMGAPGRRRAIKQREAREHQEKWRTAGQDAAPAAPDVAAPPGAGSASGLPDAGGHPPGAAERPGVAPVREEP